MKLITTSGTFFNINWASPVSVTENIVFLASIIETDPDPVHNTFKNPNETSTLTVTIEEYENETVVASYEGYTRYCGFSIENDGTILVTLKKNVSV